MTNRSLTYQLNHGYIHNWLVAGPQSQPLGLVPTDPVPTVWTAGLNFEAGLPLAHPPIDRGKLNDQVSWHYQCCGEDHRVDISTYAPIPQYLMGWAYTRLTTQSPGKAVLILAFTVPVPTDSVGLWLNGKPVYQGESAGDRMQTARVEVDLDSENEILVHIARSGARDVALAFSLRVEGPPAESATVQTPTQARFPHRFQNYERLFDHAYLEEAASYRGRVVKLHFAEDAQDDLRYAYSIQDRQAMIYVEGVWGVVQGESLDVGHPQRIFERPGWVVLRAPGKEYFEQDLRCQRRLPIYILDNSFSEAPYGDYSSRRAEALQDAARRDGLLFAELAKMVLEKWDQLDRKAIAAAIQQVRQREAGSEVSAVGLLGMALRFAQKPAFPQGLLEGLDEAVLQYAYAPAAGVKTGVDFERESSFLLVAAVEVLAGQLYPERIFALSGKSGSEHRAAGETRVEDWLRARGATGFAEWDSPEALERNIVALSHLVSLAENEATRDFSAVVLDKLLFLMAINSYHGVVGGSMGNAVAAYESAAIKTGRLQASAGIARLLWGTGIYSAQLAGVISLALSEYEFPSFFAEIASGSQEETWSRERHQAAGGLVPTVVNKVTYRTPDYLLGSAQDYRPGQEGKSEHIWQATLGADALVFTNHPAICGQEVYHRPGYWLGNGAQPRVAQWKDALAAVYNLPEDAPLGFTHAYFPTFAFDEYILEGGWAFARKDNGYVAITASAGFELVQHAPDGLRELRSQGRHNVWVCQMGRLATDGSFTQFREKVLANRPVWSDLGVQFTTLRSDQLAFGWQGAFQVNGQEVALSGFPHIDHPYGQAEYPARQMDISLGEYLMRLDLSS